MAKRIKAPAVAVPQTADEVDTILAEIGDIQRSIDLVDAALEETLAAARGQAKKEKAPLVGAAEKKFALVQAWAEANKKALTQDGRRSVVLSQGSIGWRWGNATVVVARGLDDGDMVVTLEEMGLDVFLRVRKELDREEIIKNFDKVSHINGLSVVKKENFWAKPLGAGDERTAIVARLHGLDATQHREDAP